MWSPPPPPTPPRSARREPDTVFSFRLRSLRCSVCERDRYLRLLRHLRRPTSQPRNAIRWRYPTCPIVAVVVPCYNTSSRCAAAIAGALPSRMRFSRSMTDRLTTRPSTCAASGCLVLQLPVNGGKGAALEAGFREVLKGAAGPLAARADYVVTIDGDGQHDPADIPRLVDCAPRRAPTSCSACATRARCRGRTASAPTSRACCSSSARARSSPTRSPASGCCPACSRRLIDRVTWKGYESESEVLWRTIELNRKVASVAITTIYIDGNRGSQFDAWRDSGRIASVFTRQLRWTVSMAMLDFVFFAALVLRMVESFVGEYRGKVRRRRLSGHVSSRLLGPRESARARGRTGLVPADFRRPPGSHDHVGRRLVRARDSCDSRQGRWAVVGYFGTFAAVDRVLLRRVHCSATVRTLSQHRAEDVRRRRRRISRTCRSRRCRTTRSRPHRGRSGCRSCRTRPRLRSRRAPPPCRWAARSGGST